MVGRSIIHTSVWLLVMGAILFAAAGDWCWPQAWVYLAESAISSLGVCLWLNRIDPALLEARLSSPFHRDQRRWDQVFLALAMIGFIAWLVLAALDARRYQWSQAPVWAQVLGGLLVALCMFGVCFVFQANSFAAPQVRIQADRAQTVATTGPYRFVRHPMYSVAILYFLGVPLLLGSLWTLLAAPIFVLAFAGRAVGEERMLRHALPGYVAYADKVRFRLIPGLW